MSRTKGAINRQPENYPDILDMTVEERLEFVANLIVEEILRQDLKSNMLIPKRMEKVEELWMAKQQ